MQNTQQPLLSISIMVSNRIDTIEKCMESIKTLLTKIPAELVVLDTVGENTDGSIDIVKKYTDKIYRFEWCNDFSAARNFGLEKCSGKWFMFMDDDEWFEDVSEIVEFFTSGEYKNYNCATYRIHDYTNREGTVYTESSMFRMTKQEKHIKFTGRIHEYIAGLQSPVKELSSYIHHYGYVFDSEEEQRKHSERNISLLREELEQNPWDMHMRAQLVQEYMFVPEFRKEAEKLCEETFTAKKEHYHKASFQWILFSYVRLAKLQENYEILLERAEILRKNFPLNELTSYAIGYFMLEACCRRGMYEQGVFVLEAVRKNYEFLMKYPDKKHRMLVMDFENFLCNASYVELLRQGIYCYRKTKNYGKASEICKEYFAKLTKPVLTVMVLSSNYIETLDKCLDSVQLLLQSVPSELVVVNMAGEAENEGSLAIAKKYTDKVVSNAWNEDIASAGNAGLEVAVGDWLLYLKADEWFERTDEIQNFFASGEYLEYNSAAYPVLQYDSRTGAEQSVEMLQRMTRRILGVKFEGNDKEMLTKIYSPTKKFSNYVKCIGSVKKNKNMETEINTQSFGNDYIATWKYYESIEWEKAEPSKEESFQKVLELLQEQPDVPRMVGILKRVMKNPAMIQKAWVRNAMGDVLSALKK